MSKKSDEVQPIIVKKIKKGGGGHHGGAWKVAYADFVTAMMAFFLLMWLLNVSTDEQLQAISHYFDPTHPQVSRSESGAGGVLGGLSMTTEGAMAQQVQPLTQPRDTGLSKTGESPTRTDSSTYAAETQIEWMESQLRAREDGRFDDVAEQLARAIQESATLQALADQILIDITGEGLRIQIIDQEDRPMFPSGSARMYDQTTALMTKVAELIKEQPNKISVQGHTDAHQYAPGARYTNWELSADRANASRHVLMQNNIPAERIAHVVGKADTEPFIGDNPLDARNRRISIILLREPLLQAIERGEFGNMQVPETLRSAPQPGERPGSYPLPNIQGNPVGTFQRTPGDVHFP